MLHVINVQRKIHLVNLFNYEKVIWLVFKVSIILNYESKQFHLISRKHSLELGVPVISQFHAEAEISLLGRDLVPALRPSLMSRNESLAHMWKIIIKSSAQIVHLFVRTIRL